MTRKTRPIPEGAIPDVRARLAMIEAKRLELRALEDGLQLLLSRVTGTDLDRGDWDLDPVRWVLVRTA